MRLGRTYDQFLTEFSQLTNQGYRVASLTTHVSGGQVYYSATYNPSSTPQFLGLWRNRDQFVAEYVSRYNAGWKLLAFTSNTVNGQAVFHGVWTPSGAGQYLRTGLTRAAFGAEDAARVAGGYRLAGASTYVQNGAVYYNAIWNPGSTSTWLDYNMPKPDLQHIAAADYAGGWRIGGLVLDHVEGLDVAVMGQKIKAGFSGKSVGYTTTVATQVERAQVAGGYRRTYADPPQRVASTTARINVASVSKTITAVGALHLLQTRGISLYASIAPYLPEDWVRGPNVSSITFSDLLTHSSGFRNDVPETYENLEVMIARGVNLADKTPLYTNANYSLFRVLIPHMLGTTSLFSWWWVDQALLHSALYMQYMNDEIFAPAGISAVALKPAASEQSLAYPFPSGATQGGDFGDWTDQAGGAGYHLSSDELATLLLRMRDGTLLSSSWQQTMDTLLLGWQGNDDTRHGKMAWHSGFFPLQPGELNAMVVSFSPGVQVGVEINSQTTADMYAVVRSAYETSRVALP